MYDLKPTHIYLHQDLRTKPQAMARAERMLAAMGKTLADVQPFTEADAYDVVREIQQWPPQDELPGVPVQHRREVVFTDLKLNRDPGEDPIVAACPEGVSSGYLRHVLGYIAPTQDFHAYDSDETRNMVCWPTRDFGVVTGCSHGCFYCGEGLHGKFLGIGLNIEEYMDAVVGPTVEAMPQQRCFRMIGWGADIISLEPEYQCFGPYLTKLAEHDRYGYFHSNSDNVDWVADVPHRDRLIGVWSLASEGVARQIEPGSPSAAARIEAMRKLNAWDVPVRIKFKPTIPIVGWKEDYAALIEHIFARCKPETIGFCCMIWMELDVLKQRFDGLIDPEFLQAAEDCREQMTGQTHSPFPHHMRAAMYRFLISEVRKHDPRIPIFLSTETREMWAELEDVVGQRATQFMCGCNPVQLPGPRMKTSEKIPASTYFEPKGG